MKTENAIQTRTITPNPSRRTAIAGATLLLAGAGWLVPRAARAQATDRKSVV